MVDCLVASNRSIKTGSLNQLGVFLSLNAFVEGGQYWWQPWSPRGLSVLLSKAPRDHKLAPAAPVSVSVFQERRRARGPRDSTRRVCPASEGAFPEGLSVSFSFLLAGIYSLSHPVLRQFWETLFLWACCHLLGWISGLSVRKRKNRGWVSHLQGLPP